MEKELSEIIDTITGTDCEGTSARWWCIIDPSQNMSCDPHVTAMDVTGPFFSRNDAQNFLDATRYNFGKRAVVYCMSGCYSSKWVNFVNKVDKGGE